MLLLFCRAVQILLEAGADPNAQDEFSTPFKTAARQHKKVMEGKFHFFFLMQIMLEIGRDIVV